MKAKPDTEVEHLFIKNPLSGKLINVLPLFELITDSYGGIQETVEQLQEVHDFLSTHVITCADPGSVVSVEYYAEINSTLVMFRQMFQRMKEVPI